MCRVSVTCCCHRRGGDGGWLVLVAVGVLAVLVAPVLVAMLQAAVDLMSAVVTGLVIAAGVAVAGWVVKALGERVLDAWIDARAVRRHRERTAEFQRVHRPAISVSAVRPRVVDSPRRHAIAGPAPVRIYPTPRAELHSAIAPRRIGGGDDR
jgi:hypothetical protein